MNYAINISDISKFFYWLKRMLIISANKYVKEEVTNTLKCMSTTEEEEDVKHDDKNNEIINLNAQYKNVHFILKACAYI